MSSRPARGKSPSSAAIRVRRAARASCCILKRDRAILELLYAAGIRVSEFTGLSLGDINERTQIIRVLGKGRKERIVPFG